LSLENENVEFSVAIATYNRSEIIVQTLGHVLGQTYQAAEIVVVDDGSTDATREAVASVKDARIRYLRIENSGPGVALKTAIEMCTSQWITICDDDDVWLPDHLQRRVKLISNFPESDVSFSDFTAFGTAARPEYSHFATVSSQWWRDFEEPDGSGMQFMGRCLIEKFLQENPVFPLTLCFSQDLWRRSGGIEDKYSRLGCWDAHMTWRLVLHGCVSSDHSITAKRREHSTNFSKKRSHVNMERALMLESEISSGKIPVQHRQVVEEQIFASRLRAARWAWDDEDYSLVGSILNELPFGASKIELWKYRLAMCLPTVVIKFFRG